MLTALILLITIFAALGLGVGLGYVLITSFLRAIGRRPEAPPTPAMAAGEAHGGD
ncbi:MAG: hypothetical protein ACR2IF_13340 [Terriglobales bacterium]